MDGTWPLVLANVLAAPLIEMAPVLVRRVGRRGQLVPVGYPAVGRTGRGAGRTCRLGMRLVRSATRAGWTALVVQASW